MTILFDANLKSFAVVSRLLLIISKENEQSMATIVPIECKQHLLNSLTLKTNIFHYLLAQPPPLPCFVLDNS